ncbi:MAG: mucoidy inhibitor MuiA family protein [Saprospiraceae bacterium]|nr:mucoidy inhibitor MuiA family protein [Saprospiraceae bacterium]
MKKLFVPFILLNMLNLDAQSVVTNQIKEVSVFLQGAQIFRSLELKLNAGEQEIRIKGLATNLDPNSIQLRAAGDVVLLGVKHELNYINERKNAADDMIKKKEQLKEELIKIQQQIYILQFEKNLLLKNQVQVVSVPNSNAKLEDLKLLIEFHKLKLADLLPKISELEKKEKMQQSEIEKIDRQIADLQTSQQPSSEVVLQLLSKSAGNQNFTMSYYVYDARWEMRYDIHVKDIQSPMEITYKANVYQNSGEDWKNIKIQLSTANPLESGDRPILQPWYLSNRPPVVYQQKRSAPEMAQNQAADLMQAPEGVEQFTQVQEQLTTRSYNIDLPYTVLSNNKPFHVTVRKASINAKYIYFAVPKLDPDAFLTAEISDWEDLDLMNGEAQLFLENTYQGKIFIDTRSIQDFLRLSLGRDKNVILTRTKIKDYSKNKFLSDKKEITKGYELGIKNNKSTSIELILEDQIPVSTQKEIQIEAEDISAATLESETGKLRWNLKLSSKEDKKLKLKYVVTCPKDFVLNLD